MYADKITGSMEKAMQETARRRNIQLLFNETHTIIPTNTTRAVTKTIVDGVTQKKTPKKSSVAQQKQAGANVNKQSIERKIKLFEGRMKAAAKRKDYEMAIILRDKLKALKDALHN
jgi:excinuclease ABC subunit B